MFETTCVGCGATLQRDWTADGLDLTDWSAPGEEPPRAAAEALEELVALLGRRPELRASDVAMQAYATLAVCVGQHLPIPGTHRHVAAPRSPYEGDVPECCGWPARLVRDGWLCRVERVPLVDESAA